VKESIDMTCLGMSLNITDKGIKVDMIIYIKDILQEWDGLYEYAHPTDDSLFTLDNKKFFSQGFCKTTIPLQKSKTRYCFTCTLFMHQSTKSNKA